MAIGDTWDPLQFQRTIAPHPDEAYGWKDLLGDVSPKVTGVGSPTLTTWRTETRWFAYTTNDGGDIVFHIPHDWRPASDLFLHLHWGHNGTNVSGSMVVDCYMSYAKGHQQQSFGAEVTTQISVADLNITNTPQYYHRIDEIQMTTSGGDTNMLDTDEIEVDGLILLRFKNSTIPTITGGAAKPFIFTFDIHYQTDRVATPQKAPDFYVKNY